MKVLFEPRQRSCRPYSRAERLSDATIHVIGLFAAVVGVSVLLTLTVLWRGSPWDIAATVVYCAALILMLSASAAYHMTPIPSWKDILRRIDQSAIYIKIAGTYTPFVILSGSSLTLLLAGIWSAAVAGLSLKMLAPDRCIPAALALYLCMGWAGVLVGGDLLRALEPAALTLMLAGGAIYTAGIVFFLWDALPFHNTIWHGFVLVATVIFYAAVVVQVAEVPGLQATAATMTTEG